MGTRARERSAVVARSARRVLSDIRSTKHSLRRTCQCATCMHYTHIHTASANITQMHDTCACVCGMRVRHRSTTRISRISAVRNNGLRALVWGTSRGAQLEKSGQLWSHVPHTEGQAQPFRACFVLHLRTLSRSPSCRTICTLRVQSSLLLLSPTWLAHGPRIPRRLPHPLSYRSQCAPELPNPNS